MAKATKITSYSGSHSAASTEIHPIARKITQIPIKTHKPIICLIKWLMITEKVGVCAQLIEIARNQHD